MGSHPSVTSLYLNSCPIDTQGILFKINNLRKRHWRVDLLVTQFDRIIQTGKGIIVWDAENSHCQKIINISQSGRFTITV